MARKRPNGENLRPIGDGSRTKDEERKIQSMGGKKSGESRRRKRDLKKRIADALDCAAEGDTAKKIAKAIGVEPDKATNYDVVVARLMLQAFKGDTRAMQMIFDYLGESPAEQRAEKQEEREQRLFDLRMNEIESLNRDNDMVLQFIESMKKNPKKEDDGEAGTKREAD